MSAIRKQVNKRAVKVLKELQIKNKWKATFVFVGPNGQRLQDVSSRGLAGGQGLKTFVFMTSGTPSHPTW